MLSDNNDFRPTEILVDLHQREKSFGERIQALLLIIRNYQGIMEEKKINLGTQNIHPSKALTISQQLLISNTAAII